VRSIRKFLLEYQDKNNIFSNKNYDIYCAESYGMYHRVHKVNGVKLIFEDNSVTINFRSDDYICAFYIYAILVNNDFGYDFNIKVSFNSVDIEKMNDDLLDLKILLDKKSLLTDKNIICIKYSDPLCFNFHSQNIFFLITPYHDDLYYYNLEIKRLTDEILTDDEI
jgi:hypothetical protein